MIRCIDKSIYTGVTNNIEMRFKQHKLGLNPKSYTYSRRPLELIWFEEFKYIDKAIDFEKRLKKWSRAKKLALVKDDWDAIAALSRCRNETSHEGYMKD